MVINGPGYSTTVYSYYLQLGTGSATQRLYSSELNQSLLSGALATCSSVLVVLDSCYSGGFVTGLAMPGRVILTSCNSDELSHGWAWNTNDGSPLVPPCYWAWFSGVAGEAWPPKPASPRPSKPAKVPVNTWPDTGILGGLFQAVDADNDGWITASELFTFANSSTRAYSGGATGLGKPQSPTSSYGVAAGDLPIVMRSPYQTIWYINFTTFKLTSKTVQRGFHPNPPILVVKSCSPSQSWSSFGGDASRTHFSGDPPEPNGELLWTTSLLAPVESSVAVAEGIAVVGTDGGKLFALDVRNGQLVWNFTANGPIFSSPAVTNGTVFFGTNTPTGSSFTALELATGTIMWNYTFMPYHTIISSPAVLDGRVFIGVCNNSGPNPENRMFAFNQTTGQPLWNFTTPTSLLSSPAVADGRVFFAEHGVSESPPARIWALNETTGVHLWDEYVPNSVIVSTPAVADGSIFIGTVSTGSPSTLMAFNECTGSPEWTVPTAGAISSSPAVDSSKHLVVVGDQAGFLYCTTESGTPVWGRQLSSHPINMSSAAISNNGLVFIGSTDGRLYCLNETNGIGMWNYTTGGQIISSPALVEEHVLIGSEDSKIYCFGPAFPIYDGAILSMRVSSTILRLGSPVTINYTVANKGNRLQTFYITLSYYSEAWTGQGGVSIWAPPLYLNPTTFYTTTVSLAPGANVTLTYTWKPSLSPIDIIAEVQALPNEANITDNTYLVQNVIVLYGHGGPGRKALLN
jgi:outer membrane protein assembly factor BamB